MWVTHPDTIWCLFYFGDQRYHLWASGCERVGSMYVHVGGSTILVLQQLRVLFSNTVNWRLLPSSHISQNQKATTPRHRFCLSCSLPERCWRTLAWNTNMVGTIVWLSAGAEKSTWIVPNWYHWGDSICDSPYMFDLFMCCRFFSARYHKKIQ